MMDGWMDELFEMNANANEFVGVNEIVKKRIASFVRQ